MEMSSWDRCVFVSLNTQFNLFTILKNLSLFQTCFNILHNLTAYLWKINQLRKLSEIFNLEVLFIVFFGSLKLQ